MFNNIDNNLLSTIKNNLDLKQFTLIVPVWAMVILINKSNDILPHYVNDSIEESAF